MVYKKILPVKECSKSSTYSIDDFYHLYDKALNGSISPKLFLIPGDPGTGKSRSIQEFLKEVSSGARHAPDTGIIIFLTRKAGIKTYIGEASLDSKDFAVIVQGNRADVVAEYGGSMDVENTRILFTTTQMLMKRLGGSFAGLTEYHYKGKPRALRFWDEDFASAEAVTINKDGLALARVALRGDVPDLASKLEALETDVASQPLGSNVLIPRASSV